MSVSAFQFSDVWKASFSFRAAPRVFVCFKLATSDIFEMKSRKVKAAARGKAFMSKKKLKGSIPLNASDSGSDVDSDSFFHDDIDDFHKKREDQLSTDDELIQHRDQSSEEEEVLPITDDEKEDSDDSAERDERDEEADSFTEKDESDEETDEDLPNREAWGKKKSLYYSADFVDEDRGRTYREEDAEAAKAEAEEAFAIQKSIYKTRNTTDNLGGNFLLEDSESSEEKEQQKPDLTATKEERLKYLKKTNPEMFENCSDFKSSIIEMDKLLPLLNLVNKRKLRTETCAEYIKLKYCLLLNYSTNLGFYMQLLSSGKNPRYHPVMKTIATYKKLLNQLKPIEDAVKKEIEVIVKRLEQNEEISLNDSQPGEDMENVLVSDSASEPVKPITEDSIKVKKSKRKISNTKGETEIVSLINDVKKEMTKRRKTEETSSSLSSTPQEEAVEDKTAEHETVDETDLPLDEKRAITYQIAKNKGLVPRRKKEYRNPRVKHRMKFQKAQVRRKGQVRKVIKEVRRYEGEPTGISTHVVRSIKFK